MTETPPSTARPIVVTDPEIRRLADHNAAMRDADAYMTAHDRAFRALARS